MKKAAAVVVLGLFSVALLGGCARKCAERCEPRCEPKYERVVKEYGGK